MSVKSPNPTDAFVGSRVKMQRIMMALTQEQLANALGVTFQQVQKYEKGINRIGASRLQAIANVLGVPIGFFFQQDFHEPLTLSGIKAVSQSDLMSTFLSTRDGIGLNRAFSKIKNPKTRRSIVALAKALADGSDGMPIDLAEEAKPDEAWVN